MQRRRFIVFSIGIVLTGCGGGGGGGESENRVAPRVGVRWGARSRATAVGSTALSIVIALQPVGGGTEESFVVNRPAGSIAEQTETYEAPFSLAPGEYQLTLTAYAVGGGSGSVVARGSQHITLGADGLLPDFALTGTIAAVTIPPGQSLGIGEQRALQLNVTGSSGETIALTEGSYFWEVLAGADKVRVENGLLLGTAPGLTTVRVTIDGVVSPPVSLSIVSGVTVGVSPQSVQLSVDSTKTFTAQVQGAPAGQTGVVWSLREGSAAGTIDSAGNYTATGAPGVYHVVATSVYDPSRSGEAEIQVQGGALRVGARWEETGGLGVGVR
ncbi:MAG: hypothetical protein QM758_19335 [Armatimonas sp.]